MISKGVRITNKTGRASDTDVSDLETGDKILNCYRVELDMSRAHSTVVLHLGMPFEYEGIARLSGLDAIIENAYSRYDADSRVNGPDDASAFRDAFLGALEEYQD